MIERATVPDEGPKRGIGLDGLQGELVGDRVDEEIYLFWDNSSKSREYDNTAAVLDVIAKGRCHGCKRQKRCSGAKG
jgi:hypothetical protein